MPVRRRSDKRRDAPSDDAIAFLEGRPSFTEFKDHTELVELWRAYGDEAVATWDEGEGSTPRAVADSN
jgi:hypothetical protein